MATRSHSAVEDALVFLPGCSSVDNLPQPLRRDGDGIFIYAENAWLKGTRSAEKNSAHELEAATTFLPEAKLPLSLQLQSVTRGTATMD